MNKKVYIYIIIMLTLVSNSYAINVTPETRDYVESRVYNTVDTYVINWSDDGNEYRATRAWDLGIRRVYNNTFGTLEMDPHYSQILKVLEVDEKGQFIKIAFMLLENPNNPYPQDTVPFNACVNATKIFNSRRFEVPNTFCPQGMTQYYFNRVQFNVWYTVRFETHPSPYVWWFGEDDYDGTFGQGGIGDGIPVCEGLAAGLTVSPNPIVLNPGYNDTNATMNAGFIGPSTGCSPTQISLQYFNTTTGSWRLVPTNNDTVPVDCKGISCQIAISVFGNYKREIRCDWTNENVSLRTRFAGNTPSGSSVVFSPTRVLQCQAPAAEEPPKKIDLVPFQEYDCKYCWLILLGIFPIMAHVQIENKKKKRDKNDRL